MLGICFDHRTFAQVNVGCVPKKLMFHAASHMEEVSDMKDYGIDVKVEKAFDWGYAYFDF